MSDTSTKNVLNESEEECEYREQFKEYIEEDMEEYAHLKNGEAEVYWTTNKVKDYYSYGREPGKVLLGQRKGVDPISFGYTYKVIDDLENCEWRTSDPTHEKDELYGGGVRLPWLLHEPLDSQIIGLDEDFEVTMLPGELITPHQSNDRFTVPPITRGEPCFIVQPDYMVGAAWLRIWMSREQAEKVQADKKHHIHDLLDKEISDVSWWENRGEWIVLNIILGRSKFDDLANEMEYRAERYSDDKRADFERALMDEYYDCPETPDIYFDDDHLSQYEQDWMDYTEHVIGW